MSIRVYSTPAAFKQAVEQRLRELESLGPGLTRRRQLLVFDRFLARVTMELGDAVVLKGGLALELRLRRARTTRDIDLRFAGSPDTLLARLQAASRRDLGDHMAFEVVVDADHPDIQNEGMPYGGKRFLATCSIAGKHYGEPFGVDVSIGEPMLGAPDAVLSLDLLGFAGIKPPLVQMIPVATHIAEKLHAYTLPRDRPNSRIKDLPDVALLAGVAGIEAEELHRAIELTFGSRNTHAVPRAVPEPPATWREPYAAMAIEHDLKWTSIGELVGAVEAFLNPVLRDSAVGMWSPEAWGWQLAQS